MPSDIPLLLALMYLGYNETERKALIETDTKILFD